MDVVMLIVIAVTGLVFCATLDARSNAGRYTLRERPLRHDRCNVKR